MALPSLYEHYTGGGIQAGLSADASYFTLNNKNITLYSGAMHYFRVPKEHWRDRLRKMKAAGLNTVETYVPWNLHEPEQGVYDFGDGGTDFQDLLHIEQFLKTAQQEDLFAIVRPGPYICSEWEFGGLPSWLLRTPNMLVRSNDDNFMSAVQRYFSVLLPLLLSLQFSKGGPIIAFQIENEYGSLKRRDEIYLESLKNQMEVAGIGELLVTSDGPSIGNFGQIPGVLYTGNFAGNPEKELDIMQTYQPGKPSMVMEYWSGWFDHWTEDHHTTTTGQFKDVAERILRYPSSVNFYMFHGGTSFGFMNGANIADGSTDNKGYQPDTNSYDYDAPLSEIGDPTEKYYVVKELIEKYNTVPIALPEIPEPMPRTAYETITIEKQLTLNQLVEQVPTHVSSGSVMAMELLPINRNNGQSYGYIVYRVQSVDIPPNSVLKIEGRVCDTAMILINGKLVSKVLENQNDLNGFGYFKAKDATLDLGSEAYEGATLDIVVENWGRNNFGNLAQFVQHKGLWQGQVYLNDNKISSYEIVPLEFKTNWINQLSGWTDVDGTVGPALYKATLKVVGEPVDTFIDMTEWKKGFVVVNGFVLSRHFHIGPQQTAYLPGPFLKEGDNEILVFEHFISPGFVAFSDKAIYKTKHSDRREVGNNFSAITWLLHHKFKGKLYLNLITIKLPFITGAQCLRKI